MLRHWRQLAGNLELLQSQMKKELEEVVGERAIFHGVCKTPLRKGKIDSVRAHDCLVIVDEETREVCLVPIEYVTQIGDSKLPKLQVPESVLGPDGPTPDDVMEAASRNLQYPVGPPGSIIVLDRKGDPAAIEESRRKLREELDALPQKVKEAYRGTEIDMDNIVNVTIKGAELETFHLENLDGTRVGDVPVLFGMFLMRLQNLVWSRSQRRPDLLVVSPDVLAHVVQVKGYQAHDEGPQSHGKKLVGVLPRHTMSVIVNDAFKVGTGCVRCIDPLLADVWEKFLVRVSRAKVHLERETYEAAAMEEEEDHPGVLHPCDHWYGPTCMCAGSCGCHWEK